MEKEFLEAPRWVIISHGANIALMPYVDFTVIYNINEFIHVINNIISLIRYSY